MKKAMWLVLGVTIGIILGACGKAHRYYPPETVYCVAQSGQVYIPRPLQTVTQDGDTSQNAPPFVGTPYDPCYADAGANVPPEYIGNPGDVPDSIDAGTLADAGTSKKHTHHRDAGDGAGQGDGNDQGDDGQRD